MIVVDASAVLEALLRTPAAAAVEKRLFEPSQTLHAPHLRRWFGDTPLMVRSMPSAAAPPWRTSLTSPLRRYPHDLLLPRVWDLRNNFTAYDAMYVALAEVLDAPLLTRDKRLAASPGHHARIELV